MIEENNSRFFKILKPHRGTKILWGIFLGGGQGNGIPNASTYKIQYIGLCQFIHCNGIHALILNLFK